MASVSGWPSQFPQHFYLPWPVPFLPCATPGLGYPAPVLLPPCVDVSGLAFAVAGQRRADPCPLRVGRVMVSSEAQTDPPESCGESESGRGSGATSRNESPTRPEGHSDHAHSPQESAAGGVPAGRCGDPTHPPGVRGHAQILRLPRGEREASLWSVESLVPYVPPSESHLCPDQGVSAGRARHQLEESVWSVESLAPYVPQKRRSQGRDPAVTSALQESVWSVESLAPYVPQKGRSQGRDPAVTSALQESVWSVESPQDLVTCSSRDSAPPPHTLLSHQLWSLEKREVSEVPAGQRVSRRVEAALWSIRREETCGWLAHLGEVYCCGEGRGQGGVAVKRCSCGAVTRPDDALQRGSSACQREDRKCVTRVCGACRRSCGVSHPCSSRTRTRTITQNHHQ